MPESEWLGDCGDVAAALAGTICPGCYAEWCLAAIFGALGLSPEIAAATDLHDPEWRTTFYHQPTLTDPACYTAVAHG